MAKPKYISCVGCGLTRTYMVTGAALNEQVPGHVTTATFKGPLCLPCVLKTGLGINLMQLDQKAIEVLYSVVPGVP